MNDWKSKYGDWALITGASSGIGEEFSKRLGGMGLNLILIARRKEKLEKLSEEIRSKNGIEILVIQQDLSEDSAVQNVIDLIGEREVGILINNAGFGSTGNFADHELKDYRDMIYLSCIIPTELTHHYLKGMKERSKGAVIFLGSTVAFLPVPFMSVYSAVKAFNHYLGSALWYELKKFNIDILSLNPGGTDTEFQRVANIKGGPLVRTSEDVVKTAIKSLGKKPAVVDGFINKFYISLAKLVPTKFITAIGGKSSQYLSTKK